jgi:hypothetical protein
MEVLRCTLLRGGGPGDSSVLGTTFWARAGSGIAVDIGAATVGEVMVEKVGTSVCCGVEGGAGGGGCVVADGIELED